MRGIVKRYGAAVALQDVSLEVAAGEIHALVGENGAGKSTLGKIIAGAVAPDAGEILVDGEPVSYRSPRDAIRHGIGMIQQEFALAPHRSVLDNVFLGMERASAASSTALQRRERFDELAERIGFRRRRRVPSDALRIADQQKVEVARARSRATHRLIVMDEPTAALTRRRPSAFWGSCASCTSDGMTVIYVSHFLGRCSPRTVTVLQGRRRAIRTPRRRRVPRQPWSPRCSDARIELPFPRKSDAPSRRAGRACRARA